MPDDSFDYAMNLIDSMSGPAHMEAEALRQLEGAVASVDKAVGKFESTQRRAADAMQKSSGSSGGPMASLMSGVIPEIAVADLAAGAVTEVADAIVVAARSMAEFTGEAVKFAIDTSQFKENASEAFAAVQGTAAEGRETYDMIERIARTSHTPIENAESMASQLQLQGLDNERLLYQVVQSVSDLSRVGTGQGADKLQALIQRSLATGTFKPMGRQLTGLGVSMPELVSQLAKDLHEPVQRIKNEMKAGKIGVEDGITALTTAIGNSKIHDLAAKKFTLADFAVDMKNTLTSLFEDVPIDPLLGRLENMEALFGLSADGAGGLKDAVTGAFGTIITWAAPVVDALTTFGLKAELGFLQAEGALSPLLADLKSLSANQDAIRLMGDAIGYAAQHMTRLAITTAWLVGELSSVASVGGHLGGEKTGETFVQGMVNQLLAGIGPVHDAGARVAAAAHAGATGPAGLDAHSPSRKAMDLGDDYTEGLALGAESGRGRARGAMVDAVEMPDFSSAGGSGRSVDVGGIHVEVHGGGADADGLRQLADDLLADAIDRLNLELGG